MNVHQIVGFALLGLALVGCGRPDAPALRQPTAALSVARAQGGFTDLQGQAVSLAQFKGHPVVLSFLGPRHLDSLAQLPHLIRLADAYQKEGVVFVVGGEAPVSELRKLVSEHGLAFPVWHDAAGQEFQRRGFSQLPAHEFLRADGGVAARHAGFMARGELLEAIARILP